MSLDATYTTHDHPPTEPKTFLVLICPEVQEQAYSNLSQAGNYLFPPPGHC
jgi:hypothetical protein